jgi:hypothetical protein
LGTEGDDVIGGLGISEVETKKGKVDIKIEIMSLTWKVEEEKSVQIKIKK